MECPPTELDFRQIGASCACGVVRQPPTGFVRISERGTLFFVGEDFISSCTDTKLLYKDTLSFALSASIPAFLCRKEAQRKANKRNALFQRKLFEKSFLWTLSKTFGQPLPERWGAHSGACFRDVR